MFSLRIDDLGDVGILEGRGGGNRSTGALVLGLLHVTSRRSDMRGQPESVVPGCVQPVDALPWPGRACQGPDCRDRIVPRSSTGFELGVETLNGVTRDQLNALNPAIVHYIGHLHVATAGFIAGTGIAVAALSWYGVARGEMWAWVAAVVVPVVALAVALPYHYTGTFQLNWVTHLGPIYLATLIFVVGALIALRAMTRR
jgi:hypothetical protein